MTDQPTTETDARMSEGTDVYVVTGTEQAGGVQVAHRLVRTADVPRLLDLLHELRAR